MSESAPGPAVPAPAAPPPGRPGFASTRQLVRGKPWHWRLLGIFSSVITAAVLIAAVGLTTAGATLYEKAYGRIPTAAMVYTTWWFGALFLLLAINIAGAALVRWPWRRHHLGFLTVHAGLLLLVLGFFLAGKDRLDGMLYAPPGQPVASLELPQDEVVAAVSDPTAPAGAERRASATFDGTRLAGYPSLARLLLGTLVPALGVPTVGIHPLPEPLPLLVQARDGVDLRVLALCDSARAEPGFVAVRDGTPGVPALRVDLAVSSPLMGAGVSQAMGAHWLAPTPEHNVLQLGPLLATCATCATPALVADFDAPPPTAPRGTITAVWRGQVHHLDIPATLPATTAFDPDTALEITAYVPHARIVDNVPTEDATAPLEPFVSVRLAHGHGSDRTWRTVVLAAHYLLPQPGEDAPELLYQHPQVLAGEGATSPGAFLQALVGPDRVLHLRCLTRSHGLVGHETITGADWSGLLVGASGGAMQLHADVRWLPHAEPGPEPVRMQSGEEDRATRWVQLEAGLDGHVGRRWIARGDAAPITLDDGRQVLVRYDPERYSLADRHGFTLTLDRFEEDHDPGSEQAASYRSWVTIHGLTPQERDAALARATAAEATAEARLADDPVGGWMPPALVRWLRPKPQPPPAVEDGTHLITMNAPLAIGGVTIYQTSFFPETDANGQPTGRQISVFTVAQDRGLWAKYAGSACLVLGILLLYLLRLRPF